VTGQQGARLDFVSWHSFASSQDAARRNEEIRGMVERDFPELKPAAFLLTESAGTPAEAARADSAYEAARIAALFDANSRSQRGMDLIFRAGDLVDDHFDGSRPLISRVGENTVPLPAFRLFMLLAKLGAERLKAETPPGIGAVAARAEARNGRSNAAQALVHRYDPAVPPGAGEAATVRVRFRGLPSTLLRLPMKAYRIDPETCAPREAWVAAGKANPAPAELGRKLVGAHPFAPTEENLGVFINSGEAVVEVKLAPNSVALVTLGAEPTYGAALSDRGERLQRAEQDFSAAAEMVRLGQYPRAVDALREAAEKYEDTYWKPAALYALLGIYELDLKSPQQAEAVRRELLALPLDDFARVRLLERLRTDALRRSNTAEAQSLTRRITAIEAGLAGQREWHVKRYTGG
jgi:hypothetical protein